MLISGVGVTAPLYASRIFTLISGQNKGFVSCAHFALLSIVIGNLLNVHNMDKEEEIIINVTEKVSDDTSISNTNGDDKIDKTASVPKKM